MCRLRTTEADTSEADQKEPSNAVVPFISEDVVSSLPIALVSVPLSIQITWSLFDQPFARHISSQVIPSVFSKFVFANCSELITVYGVMSERP